MNHRRIGICVGFYRPGTGLSRVMETIVQHVQEAELHFIGISYKGEQRTLGEHHTLYPCNLQGGDVYGAYQLKQRIADIQPDFVFLLNDLWVLPTYGNVCAEEAKRIPFIAYAALDGKIVKPETVNGLGFLSHLVAYTQFACQQLEQAMQANNEYKKAVTPQLHTIPHGVDTDAFYPLENLSELKNKWLPFFGIEQAIAEECFIILNANRPHGRKRIDLTIQAFAAFAKGIDEHKGKPVALIIHNAVISPEERQGIEQCAEENGVNHLVKVTPENAPFFDDSTLNILYNICDVGMNTAMGEGWGMVSMEHAATGRPQIVPAHSACGELWLDHALCIPGLKDYVPKFSVLELTEIDVAAATDALLQLYETNQYQQIAANCFSRAIDPQFNWAHIGEQWHALFQQAITEFSPA